jgi:microcystin-dependent protein
MSQGALFLPTTGVFSGLIEQNDVNAAFDALVTMNSGSSAPANAGSGGAPELGQNWLDTTTALFPIWKIYSGTAWIVVGTFDVAGGTFSPALAAGVGALTSAATVDLGSTKAAAIALAGNTGPITSLGSSAPLGSIKTVICASTPTFTNSSAIICIGGADFKAQAGDILVFAQMTSGNWTMTNAVRASGVPIKSVWAALSETINTVGYTVLVSDAGVLVIGNSATPITFALPAASTITSLIFHYKNIGAGALTLAANGAELIDGNATLVLSQNQTAHLQSNGSTQRIVDLYTAAAAGASPIPIGMMTPFAGFAAPSLWQLCAGQAISRATYALLFAALRVTATVTITIASPGVVTWTAHGRVAGDPVLFRNTGGALPTGIIAGTVYYVSATGLTTNTFQIAAAPGGASINTSGSQSGTQTGIYAPFGDGDGSTTFNVPKLNGRTVAGADNMGGTPAGVLGTSMSPNSDTPGATGGEETHVLTTPEMPSHSHTSLMRSSAGGTSGPVGGTFSSSGFSFSTDSTGGGGAHNNVQPTMIANYIIYAGA